MTAGTSGADTRPFYFFEHLHHPSAVAWQVLRSGGQRSAPRVMRVGLTLAAVVIPIQIFVGDAHGLNTLEHQPSKIAAVEGAWDTERGAPLRKVVTVRAGEQMSITLAATPVPAPPPPGLS